MMVGAHAETSKTKVAPPATAAATQPGPVDLPAPVREMRDRLLAAVHSGEIGDLRDALDWNELPPVVADEAVPDPIAYWKRVSGDGAGREILAILAKLLDAGPVVLPIGPDIENAHVFVWPFLAELPLDALTPAQEVALYRLVTPAEAQAMRQKKKWTWYRLAIGADGTWHSFKRYD